MKKKPTTDRPNVYQIVTDRILASLKEGVIPWEKPWRTPTFSGGCFPRNFRTGCQRYLKIPRIGRLKIPQLKPSRSF